MLCPRVVSPCFVSDSRVTWLIFALLLVILSTGIVRWLADIAVHSIALRARI